jgi:hypothetical protein
MINPQQRPAPPRQFLARRSESDMLAMAPIKIRLGMTDYEVPVLTNKKASEWREKLYTRLAPLVSAMDYGGIDLNSNRQTVSAAMSQKLTQELLQFPLELKTLAQEFAPNVLTDEVFDEATDEQICLAFAQIAEVGYPFFFHLWATKRALATPPEKMPTTPRVI